MSVGQVALAAGQVLLIAIGSLINGYAVHVIALHDHRQQRHPLRSFARVAPAKASPDAEPGSTQASVSMLDLYHTGPQKQARAHAASAPAHHLKQRCEILAAMGRRLHPVVPHPCPALCQLWMLRQLQLPWLYLLPHEVASCQICCLYDRFEEQQMLQRPPGLPLHLVLRSVAVACMHRVL
jgi:hypothetical protein